MAPHSARVVVQYTALPKESKAELERMLRSWLSWHCALFPPEVTLPVSMQLYEGTLEFLPALAGQGAGSALAIVDVPKQPSNQGISAFDRMSFGQRYEQAGDVPKYDLSTPTPLDAKDAQSRVLQSLRSASDSRSNSGTPGSKRGPARSRCWNCGSYAHELRDCWSARDEAAIAEAREAFNSGRKASVLGPKRYFTEGGCDADEVAGLQPGVLSEELCAALGIARSAPPPWLARMRALGYPPGWKGEDGHDNEADEALLFEDELSAQPAADGDDMQLVDIVGGDMAKQAAAAAEGEELVAYPGVNAPLPEGADVAAWQAALGYADEAQHAPKRARTDAGHSSYLTSPPSLQPLWQGAQLAQHALSPMAFHPSAPGDMGASVSTQLPQRRLSWPGAWHPQHAAASQHPPTSAAAFPPFGHQQQPPGPWPPPYQLPAHAAWPVQSNGGYQAAGPRQQDFTQQQQEHYAAAAQAYALQQAAAVQAAAYAGAPSGHIWPMPPLANGDSGQPAHPGYEEQPPPPPPLPPE